MWLCCCLCALLLVPRGIPANFIIMARTRIDPWLQPLEQPDVIWRQSTLAAIIPDFSPSDNQNKTPKMMKVLLPNPAPKLQHQEPDNWSSSEPKPFYHIPPSKQNSPFKEMQPKPKQLKPNILSSHPSLKKKHKHSKRKHHSSNDFETAASKVLAALSMSRLKPQNQEPEEFVHEPEPKKRKLLSLPDNDIRKNMIPKVVLRDIGSLISKVCPKLSSSNKESKAGTSTGSSPTVKSPVPPSLPLSPSPRSVPSSPPLLSSPPRVPPPCVPPPPVIDLNGPPVVTLEDAGPPNLSSKSPNKLTKTLTSAASSGKGSKSVASSEKSFAPFSKKGPTFAALASAAPSFSNSPIANPSSCSWPSSSRLLPKSPGQSGLLGSSKSPSKFLSLLPSAPVLVDKSKPLVEPHSLCPIPVLKTSQATEKLETPAAVPPVSRRSLKPVLTAHPSVPKASHSIDRKPRPIRNGFLGFAQEDGRKFRVCHHVNTNILATSLDLLDLHKHSETSSAGSPSTCPHCNVTFSSVKHCKYHQSFLSSENISLAPTRHNNLRENDLWLCPWCPLMATNIMYLNSHKSVCREKGRCQQEEKASSLRKNPPISSSKRNLSTSVSSNGTFPSPSKYKVVHGHVIQL